MLLEPKNGITYGPVSSRRLGRSLGINLLPPGKKVCTFDCVYCQYGWTRCSDVSAAGAALPTVEEVSEAVAAALSALPVKPAWLTFSGNGEATLHPQFPRMVDSLLRLRDRLSPSSRTAILSNSTLLGRAEVRQALARLDARIMKLDAADEHTFRAYNRPQRKLRLAEVVAGLAGLGEVTVQCLVASGPGGNDDPDHLQRWLDQVIALSPRSVQIYTLDRSAPAAGLTPVDHTLCEDLARRLGRVGIEAAAF